MLNNLTRYFRPHKESTGDGKGGITIYNINKGGAGGLNGNVDNIRANTGDFDILKANTAEIDNANIIYLMSANGHINKLSGSNLQYTNANIGNLSADNINTPDLTVRGKADIDTIINKELHSNEITTDYLTVNKTAHFFELIIDKIKSMSGTWINTAANCQIDYVEETETGWDVYWKTTQDNHEIDNQWEKYDQAICQSFNAKRNKYYWRLVDEASGNNPVYVNTSMPDSQYAVSPTARPNYNIRFYKAGQPNNGYFDFAYATEASGAEQIAHYTNWNIKVQNSLTYINTNDPDSWSDITHTWTAHNNLFGLEITPYELDEDDQRITQLMIYGTLTFSTVEPTRLNVGIYYDDDTSEIFAASEYKQNYTITPTRQDCPIDRIIITTYAIETWEKMNWISLSGTVEDANSDAPEPGDYIAQLGYRYDYLDDYEDTQQWRDEHKTEISRASAIIIAAYATPDSEIDPPSYAQYQDITRFELSTKRGTYMDANGTFVKGTIVNGSSFEPGITGLDVNVDVYNIYPIPSVIYPNDTIHYNYSHNHNGNTTTHSTLEGGLSVNGTYKVEGSTLDYGLSFPGGGLVTTCPTNAHQLTVNLKRGNELLDTTTTTVSQLPGTGPQGATGSPGATGPTGANGANGKGYEFIYTLDGITGYPDTPANLQKPFSEYIPAEEDGWGLNTPQPDVENNEYVWQSSRTVIGDVYGDWEDAMRITGANGEPGRDGDGIKYIFTRRATQPATPVYPPYGWDDGWTEQVDVTNIYWNDNILDPYGNDNKYGGPAPVWAAISTTRIENNGHVYWTNFNEPHTWTRPVYDGATGQPGQDGATGQQGQDGENGKEWKLIPVKEEYLVKLISNPSTAEAATWTSARGYMSADLYYAVAEIDGENITYLTNFNDYEITIATDNWNPTPQSQAEYAVWRQGTPTGTNITIDTITTKDGGNWTCLHYNEQSTNYDLYKSDWANKPRALNVKLSRDNEDLDEREVRLVFDTAHSLIINDYVLNSVYQSVCGATGAWTTNGFSQFIQKWDNINFSVNNFNWQDLSTTPVDNNLQQYGWQLTHNSYASLKPVGEITYTDIRAEEWTKHELYADNSYNYSWITMRERQEDGYGVSGLNYTNWSDWSTPQIYSRWNGSTGKRANTINSANLDITANQIRSDVSTTYQTKGNYVTYSSTLLQTAEQISAHVYNDVNGDLQDTGIDITNGKINLQADKVTFSSTNGATGKIWIDPGNGTLHATDGDFNGTVTATNGTFNGVIKATTLYSDAYNIPDGVTAINIGTSNDRKIYTQYLRQGGNDDVNIYLPHAGDYPGLEIGFLFFTHDDFNITRPDDILNVHSIIINKGNNEPLLRAKTTSFVPAVYNYAQSTPAGIYYGWKNSQTVPANYNQILIDTIMPPMKGASWIKIIPNTLTKFKSISGRWYQIEGNNITGSTPQTPD